MPTIRNKRTGEVKVIEESELPTYGIEVSKSKKPGKVLGGYLPLAGGLLGGLIGGLPALPGGPLALGTGAAGAAVGGASGVALENLLADLLGTQTQTPEQKLGQAGGEALSQGVGYGLGGIGGKVLSKLFNPIRSLAQFQNKVLSKSPRVVNIGENIAEAGPSVIERVRQEVLPLVERKGMGTEALQGFRNLLSDVATAVSTFGQKAPGIASTTTAGELSLPVQSANLLKREFGTGIRESYGKLGTAEEQLRKGFVRMLGQEVSKGEPAVKLSNLLMRALYLPGNIGQGVLRAGGLFGPAGYYGGRALEALGSLPGKALGKLGDVAKYILPPAFQSSFRRQEE